MKSFIELRGVSKKYFRLNHPETQALKHVNLSIDEGDIFGVIGLSGAGKSTLLRCLATLEKPSFGAIFLEGQDITSLQGEKLREIRRQMGMIFQHFNLLSSRTVEENISYPLEICGIEKEERGRRVSELLGLVGLTKQREFYPAQLSGGQKQRVGIARALANVPKILLCDEATSALDPQTTSEILFLLKDLQKKLNLTVVCITHEMDVIKQFCHKVAILEEGEVVEVGRVSEVFSFPKHPITKKFVEKTIHEIPPQLLSGKGKILHLHFVGEKADQPILSQMVRAFDVHANILLGWIDSLQSVTVGNLIIELTGEEVEDAIAFLRKQKIQVEERIV